MKKSIPFLLILSVGLLIGFGEIAGYVTAQPPGGGRGGFGGPSSGMGGGMGGRPGGGMRQHRRMEPIDLPEPTVEIEFEGEYRVIRSNGLPSHETGEFPNNGNPNAIRPQEHEYKVPLEPKISARPSSARPQFGIGLNGVIFDAGTGEFWTPSGQRGRSLWNYDAMGGGVPLGIDQNHAHVQPTGKYHYHGPPTGLLAELGATEETPKMVQIGWAFDGFPIYGHWAYSKADDSYSELKKMQSSYRLKAGERPESPDGPGGKYDGTYALDWEFVEGHGDLDECNGRTGVTPEFPDGTYYYVVTKEYPSVPRLFRGQPGPSARRGPPGGGPGGRGGQGMSGRRPRGPRGEGRGEEESGMGRRGNFGGQDAGPEGSDRRPPPPHEDHDEDHGHDHDHE